MLTSRRGQLFLRRRPQPLAPFHAGRAARLGRHCHARAEGVEIENRRFVTGRRGDEKLLDRARRGDSVALGVLYDRYGSVAYGLALRVLDDPDLAATAVEDAFAELTRETPPDGVTARSRILTLVRGRAVELRPENAEARSGPGLESSGHVAERARALRALDLLPYDQREVVALAYYDGCTLDEIADRLHQPRETVVRTLRDGLAALQRASNEADQGRPAGADPEPRRPGTLGVSIGAVHAHRGRPRSFPSSDPE